MIVYCAREKIMKKVLLICICFISVAAAAVSPVSQSNLDFPDKIYQKLGQKIGVNLSFTNQNGKTQTIHDLLRNNSVLILTLNYYRCTTMCSFQYLNLAKVLKKSSIPIGKGFQVASISFDPTDTVQQAKQLHDIWAPRTGNPNAAWSFFVGSAKNIEILTKQLNFYYAKDNEGNYSHAGALFFIRPDGTFYRYLYGITYDKGDFEHALKDTFSDSPETMWDKILGLFNRYDPMGGRYFSIFSNF